MRPLLGKVALVAGATRGAGRGIACMLGQEGATVYCTGRSVRGQPATPGRPETIEETAEMVNARGGVGIHARVDHTVEEQVAALLQRIRQEQGRLDVLVNDVWGGDALMEWGKPFWTLSLQKGLLMLERAIHSHIVTARHATPLMLEGGRGLIVEMTDGDEAVNAHYRGNLFYDLVKVSLIRLAFAMACELRDTQVTALALTPGFLRSEAMLEHFGVAESNWRDAVHREPSFAMSETPFFVGRAVAALAADPNVADKAGQALSSWELAKAYGFSDVDGRQPDMGRYLAAEQTKRWPALVAAVRKELKTWGLEPETCFDHDPRRMRLRGRLASRGEPRWFVYPVLVPDLFRSEAAKLAEQFVARYVEAIERARGEEAKAGR